MKNHKGAFGAVMLAVLVVAGCSTKPHTLSTSGLQSASLTILVEGNSYDLMSKPYEVDVTDRSQLARLLKIIEEASPVPMHKCANVGSLKLIYERTPPVWMDLYPGHERDKYEIQGAEGQLYQMDRARFFAVLAEAGADTSRIPR